MLSWKFLQRQALVNRSAAAAPSKAVTSTLSMSELSVEVSEDLQALFGIPDLPSMWLDRRPKIQISAASSVRPVANRREWKSAPRKYWHPINEPLIWQGTELEAMEMDAPPQSLKPPWKVILLSDGSVTRHLKLMTSLDVEVDCLEMHDLGDDCSAIPAGAQEIPGPWLRRQVFLRTPTKVAGQESDILVYATSWWNSEQAKTYLAKEEQPIWVSLMGSELRREIQYVYHGYSAFLEEQLGVKGPFWGRQYVFYWQGGKPLTCIYEVFSPKLKHYLGAMDTSVASEADKS